MKEKIIRPCITRLSLLFLVGFLPGLMMIAQQQDTLHGRNIYKPQRSAAQDTIYPTRPDSEQLHHIQDSMAVRMQFVRDSLLAREIFVHDSLIRRKRIIDSLTFLQGQLQGLLEAYFRAVKEDIILRCHEIRMVGDSTLGSFVYMTLPFGVRDPYIPWKTSLSLDRKSLRYTSDSKTQRIKTIQTSLFKASFTEADDGRVLVIHEPSVIQNNWAGHFYKDPVDSVFFDRYARIVKIKNYAIFYAIMGTNQRGNFLFTNCMVVKQYEYGAGKEISQYQAVKFCERWKAYDASKVCSILTYTFTKKGNDYLLSRKNDPANSYSDGTYTFAFDNHENLTGISFVNQANTENWQRTIELNSDGNVSCYLDKTNEIIRQSLCMVYHDKDPLAKYAVEIITTIFEKDGISYLQQNNTTGKARTRDRMTLEWSPWQ